MALAEYGNAFNIDTDGSGNPILIDPQSGDTIATYDRATGSWQVTTIEAATGDFDSVNTEGPLTVGGSQLSPLRLETVLDDTDGTEVSYSFDNPQKYAALFLKGLNFLGTDGEIRLQFNGDSGNNYSTRLSDTTEPAVSDAIVLSDEGSGRLSGWIWIWVNGGIVMGASGDLTSFDFQPTMDQAQYSSTGSISSFRLFDTNGDEIVNNLTEVYTVADY